MGGFHALDLIVIVGIALLIFGPKTLQSISRNAGRGLGQAKEAKNRLLADLPMEDLAQVSQTVSQIPLSPQQAARKLITSALSKEEKKALPEPAEEVVQEEQ